jgi:hypothetical protein
VNFTEHLQEILDWIASHGKRLSRPGFQAPEHLAGARVYFFDAGTASPRSTYADEKLTIEQTHPIILGGRGTLVAPLGQCWLKPHSKYRLQVHDSDDAVLFTEDHLIT